MTKSNFLLGIFAAVIGLLVLVQPDTSIKVVTIILGMTAVIRGINDFVRIRTLSDDSVFKTTVFVRGAVSLVIGVFAICLPLAFFNTAQTMIRVLLYIQAVYLILSAIAGFFLVAKLGNTQSTKNFKTDAAFSVVIAIFLFLLPANFGVILVRIIGLVLLVSGACYALYSWRNQELVVTPDSVQDAESPDSQNQEDSESTNE